MTVKTHCDNHNCGVKRTGDEEIITNGLGRPLYGTWWTLIWGDYVYHFHDIHCLERWTFDEAAKHQLKADVER